MEYNYYQSPPQPKPNYKYTANNGSNSLDNSLNYGIPQPYNQSASLEFGNKRDPTGMYNTPQVVSGKSLNINPENDIYQHQNTFDQLQPPAMAPSPQFQGQGQGGMNKNRKSLQGSVFQNIGMSTIENTAYKNREPTDNYFQNRQIAGSRSMDRNFAQPHPDNKPDLYSPQIRDRDNRASSSVIKPNHSQQQYRPYEPPSATLLPPESPRSKKRRERLERIEIEKNDLQKMMSYDPFSKRTVPQKITVNSLEPKPYEHLPEVKPTPILKLKKNMVRFQDDPPAEQQSEYVLRAPQYQTAPQWNQQPQAPLSQEKWRPAGDQWNSIPTSNQFQTPQWRSPPELADQQWKQAEDFTRGPSLQDYALNYGVSPPQSYAPQNQSRNDPPQNYGVNPSQNRNDYARQEYGLASPPNFGPPRGVTKDYEPSRQAPVRAASENPRPQKEESPFFAQRAQAQNTKQQYAQILQQQIEEKKRQENEKKQRLREMEIKEDLRIKQEIEQFKERERQEQESKNQRERQHQEKLKQQAAERQNLVQRAAEERAAAQRAVEAQKAADAQRKAAEAQRSRDPYVPPVDDRPLRPQEPQSAQLRAPEDRPIRESQAAPMMRATFSKPFDVRAKNPEKQGPGELTTMQNEFQQQMKMLHDDMEQQKLNHQRHMDQMREEIKMNEKLKEQLSPRQEQPLQRPFQQQPQQQPFQQPYQQPQQQTQKQPFQQSFQKPQQQQPQQSPFQQPQKQKSEQQPYIAPQFTQMQDQEPSKSLSLVGQSNFIQLPAGQNSIIIKKSQISPNPAPQKNAQQIYQEQINSIYARQDEHLTSEDLERSKEPYELKINKFSSSPRVANPYDMYNQGNDIEESQTLKGKLKQESFIDNDRSFAANDRSFMANDKSFAANDRSFMANDREKSFMNNGGSFMANDRDDIETLRQRENTDREQKPTEEYKDLSNQFEFDIQLPEYKGIQNLTGLNISKNNSVEKNDDLYRLNSVAGVDDDHQDLQALYQNLASANEKNAARKRQEVEDIKREIMESRKEQHVLSDEMMKLANAGGVTSNLSKASRGFTDRDFELSQSNLGQNVNSIKFSRKDSKQELNFDLTN